MSTTTAVGASSAGVNTWERLWRQSGLNFVLFFVVANVLYGQQPHLGASSDALAAFYDGHRTRILIAAVISGLAVLNLMWFAASIRTTLEEAGQGGWGAAATASSAAVGGLFLLLISVSAALAYSIAGTGQTALLSILNDFTWACVVMTSFPRAMLIMSGTFGLWRAGMISNASFAAGVTVVVLGVAGGTTWMRGGFWAPDGGYARFVWPVLGLVWVLAVSRILLTRSPATRAAW